MWLFAMLATLGTIWGTGNHFAFRTVTPPPAPVSDPITGSLEQIRASLNDLNDRVTHLGA